MKKLLVILFSFFVLAASAQTHTVSADGTSFSIDGKVYARGTVRVDTPVGSTGMAIATAATGSVVCYMTAYTNYKRQGGVAFASRKAFLAFADSFMFSASSSGGVTSITAGTGLSGGTITTTGTIALLYPYPAVVASVNLTAQTTAGTVLDYTVPVASAYYELDWSAFITTTRLSKLTLSYTDENGVLFSFDMYGYDYGASATPTTLINVNFNTGFRMFGLPYFFKATNSTHITLVTTVAGTPNFDLNVVLKRLN